MVAEESLWDDCLGVDEMGQCNWRKVLILAVEVIMMKKNPSLGRLKQGLAIKQYYDTVCM